MMNMKSGGRPKKPNRISRPAGDRQRARLLHELARQLFAERSFGGGARDDDTGGGRDQQRRDLGDDAFTDRQQRVRCSDRERHPLLHDADHEAADDVDEDDDDRRDGVAAHELRCAVHRAVEVGRALDVFAALARFGFGDQPGVEVGVDGQLFAGHRVEVKRAATSATRPAPLVMTTNWMTTRIAKITMPTA
jgi:hypothetical protein